MPVTTWTALRQHRYASWRTGKSVPSSLPDLATFRRYCFSAARPSTPPETLRRIWTSLTRHWPIPPEADPLALLARHPNTPPDILAALAGVYPDEFIENPVAALLPLENPAFVSALRDGVRLPYYVPGRIVLSAMLRRSALPAVYARTFADHPDADVREAARNHVALVGEWNPVGPEWRRALHRLRRETPVPRRERDRLRELADYSAPDSRIATPGGLTIEATDAIHALLTRIGAGPTEGERTVRRYCRRNGIAAPPFVPLFDADDRTNMNLAYNRLYNALESGERGALLYTLAHDRTLPPEFLMRYGAAEGQPEFHPFTARNPATPPEARQKILQYALRQAHGWPGIVGFLVGRGAGSDSRYWSLWERQDAFDTASRFTRIGLALNPDTPPALRDLLAERDGDRLVRAGAQATRQGTVLTPPF